MRIKTKIIRTASLTSDSHCMLRSLLEVASFLLSFFLCYSIAPQSARAATFQIFDDSGIYMTINGRLEEGDADRFIDLMLWAVENDLAVNRIILNSSGGNLYEAMRIGRLVRQLRITTDLLSHDQVCHSSCALIYLAGHSRFSLRGELGFHRPYLTGSPTGSPPSRQELSLIYSDMIEYIRSMGGSQNLIDIIMLTPPEQMYVLRGSVEIERLVPRQDHFVEMVNVWEYSAYYNLPMEEYRRRSAFVWSERDPCGIGNEGNANWLTCVRAYLWGISETEYLERSSIADKICEPTESQRAEFQATLTAHRAIILANGGDPLDLDWPRAPYQDALTECRISVMRG